MGEGNGNGKAPVLGCGMSVFQKTIRGAKAVCLCMIQPTYHLCFGVFLGNPAEHFAGLRSGTSFSLKEDPGMVYMECLWFGKLPRHHTKCFGFPGAFGKEHAGCRAKAPFTGVSSLCGAEHNDRADRDRQIIQLVQETICRTSVSMKPSLVALFAPVGTILGMTPEMISRWFGHRVGWRSLTGSLSGVIYVFQFLTGCVHRLDGTSRDQFWFSKGTVFVSLKTLEWRPRESVSLKLWGKKPEPWNEFMLLQRTAKLRTLSIDVPSAGASAQLVRERALTGTSLAQRGLKKCANSGRLDVAKMQASCCMDL